MVIRLNKQRQLILSSDDELYIVLQVIVLIFCQRLTLAPETECDAFWLYRLLL